ncbi:Hypothetical predicted protein [Cloeon dipterum]|uniref:Uncharacterized protein n=1 Tax=Cloeon dipterum TaxID=197152 RepID=A0A8S1CI72_9INSE|nr:Hypothetical predicted protein [Cloeon dipterum]
MESVVIIKMMTTVRGRCCASLFFFPEKPQEMKRKYEAQWAFATPMVCFSSPRGRVWRAGRHNKSKNWKLIRYSAPSGR